MDQPTAEQALRELEPLGCRAYSEAAHRPGSERGSPNHGSTLLSKRVTEQIRLPVRVRTRRPVPWRMPVEARRYAPNAG
jgi:hypothetical protein